MIEEMLHTIVATQVAHERVLTLLLSDRLKRLSPSDAMVLTAALDPSSVTPPPTDNIGLADDLAGRTVVYREVVNRVLKAAQEIANLKAE